MKKSTHKKIQAKRDKEINTQRQGIFPNKRLGMNQKRVRNVRSS